MPKKNTFLSPGSPVKVIKTGFFGGTDLSGADADITRGRSRNAVNMIRDTPGKVRKRTGYYRLRLYPGRVNGIFEFRSQLLVHSATELWLDGEEPRLLRAGLADTISGFAVLGGRLWILDGVKLLCFDGETAIDAEDIAYVPTVCIARAPAGGGTPFEPVNMLGSKRTDSFLGTADATAYQLSFGGLSSEEISVEVMTSGGDWTKLYEGVDFSAERSSGCLIFAAAPGASPVTGEDNLRATYSVDNPDYADRVNKCKFGICYGALGGSDRLFISGNSDLPDHDFYSQVNNPAYFGDLWYGVMGQEGSPVTGYSVIGRQLAAHKRGDSDARNIILRYSSAPEQDYGGGNLLSPLMGARFLITDVIQGPGTIAPKSFGFAREPIFLTPEGVCSASPRETTNERYIKNRGARIDKALLSEPDIQNAYACVHEGFYTLAVNNKMYLLDTRVPLSDAPDEAAGQYEAYVWDSIPARVVYSAETGLYFGSADGGLYRFFEDADDPACYCDYDGPVEDGGGRAISARWDFDFSGTGFYNNKRVRFISVRLAPAAVSSLEVFVKADGAWRELPDAGGKTGCFSFEKLVFSEFGFSSDTGPRTLSSKIRIEGASRLTFSLRNSKPGQPFGLSEIAVGYIERGKDKKYVV